MARYFSYQSLLIILLTFFVLSSCGSKKPQQTYIDLRYPKREFRGVWVQTAWTGNYKTMNSTQLKAHFVNMLNEFHEAGINALIFQVRPQADAFYYSELEPWSSSLTGTQGKPMDDGFDPLPFLIDECHKRNIELHAWLNPYRVTMSENQVLADNHIYYQYPERFVKYGNQIYFDPGFPANREFICQVVKDIVARYKVDAIHMDDYFYPYPIAGKPFPDNRSFAIYGSAQGFDAAHRDDWRRNNVNLLVEEIKATIMETKPWVRFGISPFGIYRNKKSTPDGTGSNTAGLQNYDDLYADVKLWAKKGWVDYNIPQIYWEIGHKSADYSTLIEWWANNNLKQPLYVGQDIKRTMDAVMPSGDNQLSEKMRLARSYKTVTGNCFWYGQNILENYRGVTDKLKSEYHKYPALIPPYTLMYKGKPKKVKKVRETYTQSTHWLLWERDGEKGDPLAASYFVIYRFADKQKENLEDARNIVGITRENKLALPYEGGKRKYRYVVTAVDAFHNESKGVSKKVAL